MLQQLVVKIFGLRSSVSPFVFLFEKSDLRSFFSSPVFQQTLNLQNKWYTTSRQDASVLDTIKNKSALGKLAKDRRGGWKMLMDYGDKVKDDLMEENPQLGKLWRRSGKNEKPED